MRTAAELQAFKRRMKRRETPAERLFRLRLEAAKIPHKRHVIVGFYIAIGSVRPGVLDELVA